MTERRSHGGPKDSATAAQRATEVRAADEIRAENRRLDAALLAEAEAFDPARLGPCGSPGGGFTNTNGFVSSSSSLRPTMRPAASHQ